MYCTYYTLRNRIGIRVDMGGTEFRPLVLPVCAWRQGQMESLCREEITGSFKRDARNPKSASQQCRQGSSEGMACEPYIGSGEHGCDVVEEVCGGGVVDGLFDEGVLQACEIALVGSAGVAVADGGPGPVDAGTAAGEEQVVVQLVVSARGPADAAAEPGGAFEGDDDGLVFGPG